LPKYLRVVVEAEDDHGADTLTKVNIRVPFQLLRAGVKLANFLPPKARTQVNEALREKGVDFDLNQIKPENLDELIEQLQDMVIDIDHDKRTRESESVLRVRKILARRSQRVRR
jgi:hypothetical protein